MTADRFQVSAVRFQMTAVWFEKKPTQPIYVIPTERSDEGSQMLHSTPFKVLKKTLISKSLTAKLIG
jgi:hypothetical protein